MLTSAKDEKFIAEFLHYADVIKAYNFPTILTNDNTDPHGTYVQASGKTNCGIQT